MEWRPVTGYESLYEVSDGGQVRSVQSQAIRRTKWDRAGYELIVLIAATKRKQRLVHRLVAAAFIGPCPAGYQVNHIDGNKANNCLTNLEYVTPAQNQRHAADHGLKARGERNFNAKLSEADIYAIRERNESNSIAAAKYGVHLSTINKIRQSVSWKHLSNLFPKLPKGKRR